MTCVLFVGKKDENYPLLFKTTVVKTTRRDGCLLSSQDQNLARPSEAQESMTCFLLRFAAVSSSLLLLLLLLLLDDEEEAAGWKLTLDTALACAFGIRVG